MPTYAQNKKHIYAYRMKHSEDWRKYNKNKQQEYRAYQKIAGVFRNILLENQTEILAP